MSALHLEFDVAGNNFVSAGSASDEVKKTLKMLGVDPVAVRKVAIAMYEGEINMVIHAGGGKASVDIDTDKVKIVLADEISPDTCRFWDAKTGEKLDKDRFRRDMGGVEDAYKEIFRRVTEGE